MKLKTLNESIKKRKRGSEAIENILMMWMAVSLIVAIFYPQLSSLVTSTFITLENWFTNAIGSLAH